MGHSFATRLQNVFVIGKGTKPWVATAPNIYVTYTNYHNTHNDNNSNNNNDN